MQPTESPQKPVSSFRRWKLLHLSVLWLFRELWFYAGFRYRCCNRDRAQRNGSRTDQQSVLWQLIIEDVGNVLIQALHEICSQSEVNTARLWARCLTGGKRGACLIVCNPRVSMCVGRHQIRAEKSDYRSKWLSSTHAKNVLVFSNLSSFTCVCVG